MPELTSLDAASFSLSLLLGLSPSILSGVRFDGIEAVRRLETWLIKNHGFQPQYVVPGLSEKNFWRMFDGGLYEHCRRKYRAIGTFMSVYYNSKKGKKTEKGLQDTGKETTKLETPEVDKPAN